MKRIAVLTLLVALGAGWSMPTIAQDTGVSQSDRRAEKLAQKQQKALYEYQRKQEKAQQKAQRKADKQQQKAAKKYEKEQRKLLKNANRPEKHTSQVGEFLLLPRLTCHPERSEGSAFPCPRCAASR